MNRRILAIAAAILFVVTAVLAIWIVRQKHQQAAQQETAESLSLVAAGQANQKDFSSLSAPELYTAAMDLEKKGEFLKAKEIYQKMIGDHPDFKDIALIQKRLEDLNLRIIFSGMETPKTVVYQVQPGDSLAKISRQQNISVELLKKSNGLTSDIIRPGQKLRIWKGAFSVFVDKSQNILILRCDDEVIKVYNVSTGTNNITPVGRFKIVNKIVDPPWFKNGKVIPFGSPENILGTRWIGFDIPGYGIHGTTQPDSIGKQVTAGCVRMHNQEVEELYSLLPVGTEVTIAD